MNTIRTQTRRYRPSVPGYWRQRQLREIQIGNSRLGKDRDPVEREQGRERERGTEGGKIFNTHKFFFIHKR